MRSSRPPVAGRVRVVAWALATPALLGLFHTIVLEAYRVVHPASELFTGRPAATFADALRTGSPETTYAFLRDGVDPNQPISFRDDAITNGRAMMASPLMVAVAARNGNAVVVLLSFGARLDLPQNARALCLARHVGAGEIADFIDQNGRPPAPAACPEPPPPDVPPLPFYLQSGAP